MILWFDLLPLGQMMAMSSMRLITALQPPFDPTNVNPILVNGNSSALQRVRGFEGQDVDHKVGVVLFHNLIFASRLPVATEMYQSLRLELRPARCVQYLLAGHAVRFA
mgnify:CR=1 FL=1